MVYFIYVYRYILYTYIYLFSYFGSVVAVAEVCRNASPENRCWYCLVNNFDGLAIDDIVAVFSDVWVVGVPFLEIDVNIVIAYCLRDVGVRDCSFPFWKNEFFRLDDDFIYFSKSRLADDGC